MNGLIIALVAHCLVGISLVIDKTFLRVKQEGNVLTYIFWIGIFNILAILLIPLTFFVDDLGIVIITLPTIFYGILAGLAFFFGMLFYYNAVQRGEASETVALLGGFAPMATLLVGDLLYLKGLNLFEGLGFMLLVIGGLILFFCDKTKFKKTIFWVIAASIASGLLNVCQKLAYDHSNFVTGFIIMKLMVGISASWLLVLPKWRAQIIDKTAKTERKHKYLYIGNRFMAGIASVMLSYAIRLTHPALVEATSAVKYLLIFFIVLGLTIWFPKILKENFRAWVVVGKLAATILIVVGVAILILQKTYAEYLIPPKEEVAWGVSFSKKMSVSLGLDWQKNYIAILDELKPRGIRLAVYWDEVEVEDDKWDFTNIDWQMNEARVRGVPVILAIGQKVPRWPECHIPKWVDTNDAKTKRAALLDYTKQVTTRYQNYDNLLYWQVENEVFFTFGNCPDPKTRIEDFGKETELVRKLDIMHKIITTDGGEWGGWQKPAKRGDILGVSMYRKVYKPGFGYINLPLTPEYYTFKKNLLRRLLKKPNFPVVIIELGLEPWAGQPLEIIPYNEQVGLFTAQDFSRTIDYARRARFNNYYLWGAEWWYWMKTRGNGIYWKQAQEVINTGADSLQSSE